MKRKRTKSPSRSTSPATPARIGGHDSAAAGEGASFPVVGIGASAGGLEAFTNLLKNLPLDTGMAFVLVQHLDPVHESALTQILGRATSLPVTEIRGGQRAEPNHVHVIPRDANLSIERGAFKLEKRPRTRAPHRPIDLFFESLAQDQRGRAIGVVLSGTASDGTLGLEAIRAEGGITFAQDDSAKHDSMPRSAIAAGVVDLVLSPANIAKELDRIAKHPYGTGQTLEASDPGGDGGIEEWDRAEATAHEDDRTALPSGGRPRGKHAPTGKPGRDRKGAKNEERASDNGYRKIMLLLRGHSGVDFSLYRSSTIQRRITRRMVLNNHDTPGDYASFLKGNARELDSLYSDVLISVTSFFRNPEAFDSLQRQILPELFRQRTGDPVRCWVLGCSTGQEAYSIAIAFVEAAEKAPRTRQLQVFATDLNDKLLDKARLGLYAKSLADDISPERLRRFFVEEEGGYRVIKLLREMVVFARQNLINDPPFSRMDLISCRNLLIYLEPALQKRALPTFHYALKPGGFLMLGASESIGPFTELFDAVDKKYRIYSKKPAPTPALHLPIRLAREDHGPGTERPVRGTGGPLPLPIAHANPALPDPWRGELSAQREADRISIRRFAPPGVMINDQLQVLQFRGPTGAYLEPPAGKASFDVLKMAREGLMLPLRAAIGEAKKEGKTVRREGIRVKRNGKTHPVNLEVIPLKNLTDPGYLILFGEADRIGRASPRKPEAAPKGPPPSQAEERTRLFELEADLAETREYLQSMQEQHEAYNEELQAANEEAQSANEELQSINEELETSKEELESANEELRTVNEEMSSRNTELARLNDDLVNLHTSIKTAIVLVGRDLRIRRFNAQAQKLFDLFPTDLGRPIGHIRHGLAPADLETIASEVIATVHEQECEVKQGNARWFLLRVSPYLTTENKVDGAVLVLVDIDALKRAEDVAESDRARLAAIVTFSEDAVISKDLSGVITTWNRGAERLFGYTAAEAVGKPVTMLIPDDRLDEEPKILERIHRGEPVDHYETVRRRKDGTRLEVSLTVSPIRDASGRIIGASKIARDFTERSRLEQKTKEQAEELADLHRRKDEFLAMLSHELRNPLAPIANAVQLLRLQRNQDPLQQQASIIIERQVGNLIRLVDDLLEVSRITTGRIHLHRERVALNGIVERAGETVRTLVGQRRHVLNMSLPPQPIWLNGDAARLEQVVVNLLTNAAKYTEDGGHIWLSVEQEGDEAVLRVRDSGVGIPPELLPRIFDLFTQAERTLDRSQGGLGIGLSLVQRLAELHGGRVEAYSALGQGSEFVVRLPVMLSAAASPSPPTERAEPAGSSLRVLVVDDNMDSAEMLATLLKVGGHDVRTVYEGTTALEAAIDHRPDVVLLDLGLPGLNGYEVAKRLRQQSFLGNVVLIAMTGYGQETDRQRSQKAGFAYHLVKPTDFGKVQSILATVKPG